jgi:hypothetical protein
LIKVVALTILLRHPTFQTDHAGSIPVTRSKVLEPDTVARSLVFVAMMDAYSIFSDSL